MQIILEKEEIEEAVIDYVKKLNLKPKNEEDVQVNFDEDTEISVSYNVTSEPPKKRATRKRATRKFGKKEDTVKEEPVIEKETKEIVKPEKVSETEVEEPNTALRTGKPLFGNQAKIPASESTDEALPSVKKKIFAKKDKD
jgi:hypothetical protein